MAKSTFRDRAIENGAYEFKDLAAGRYSLNASKGSYVGLSYGQTRPLEPGKIDFPFLKPNEGVVTQFIFHSSDYERNTIRSRSTKRNAYFAMQTFLGSVKNLNASSPPSRPTPLCFIPPKGTRRSRTVELG